MEFLFFKPFGFFLGIINWKEPIELLLVNANEEKYDRIELRYLADILGGTSFVASKFYRRKIDPFVHSLTYDKWMTIHKHKKKIDDNSGDPLNASSSTKWNQYTSAHLSVCSISFRWTLVTISQFHNMIAFQHFTGYRFNNLGFYTQHFTLNRK